MASEQGMSGIDLKAVTSELCEKLPLWIDKVYQFDSRTLGIRLNGENKARYQMIIEAGRRAHLVRDIPEPPKNPPQFAMFLRKYISGGKVLAIRQHGLERILIFDIGKGQGFTTLSSNFLMREMSYWQMKSLPSSNRCGTTGSGTREIVPNATYTLGNRSHIISRCHGHPDENG